MHPIWALLVGAVSLLSVGLLFVADRRRIAANMRGLRTAYKSRNQPEVFVTFSGVLMLVGAALLTFLYFVFLSQNT